MYYIVIYDKELMKGWRELFDSYYKFRNRYYRLKYSKKLVILSMSNLYE